MFGHSLKADFIRWRRTTSPKFLGNLHCAYAWFCDSGVTARSSP